MKRIFLPPQQAAKLTVVLDLDETLIHSVPQPLVRGDAYRYDDWFDFDLFDSKFRSHRRPHVDRFLKEVASKYEIVLFTASIREYGEKIISVLDPKKELISYALFREHCTYVDPTTYTKNLEVLGRPMNRIVLIDNNPTVFEQKENALWIPSFYDQKDDDVLLVLLKVLDVLGAAPDVRSVLSAVKEAQKNAPHQEVETDEEDNGEEDEVDDIKTCRKKRSKI